MLQVVVSNVVVGVADPPENTGAFSASVGKMAVNYLDWSPENFRTRKFDLFDSESKVCPYRGCRISHFLKSYRADDGTVIITDALFQYEEGA